MTINRVNVFLHGISTVVPGQDYEQSFARDRMIEWTPDSRSKRVIRFIYDRSGIRKTYAESRITVLSAEDFLAGLV